MEKQTNLAEQKPNLISILITQNGYSFYGYHTKTKLFQNSVTKEISKSTPDEIWLHLEQELVENQFYEYNHAKIQIIYHHSYFAVVPNELYDPKHKSDYLKFNTQLEENDIIANDVNAHWEVSIPFIPYVNIHNELLNNFEQINFTHSTNVALSVAKKLIKNKTEKEQVLVFADETTFILVIAKNNQLIYINRYEYDSAEDFVFYSLFALEQYKCNRNQIIFSIIGNTSAENEIYHYLEKYVHRVEMISTSELISIFKLNKNEGDIIQTSISNPFLVLHLCE